MIKIPNKNPQKEDGPAFANMIKPTFNGKLISVNYRLSVHVKHDAWNEWGRGKGVCLPIKIQHPQAPMQVMQEIAAQGGMPV